jgi:hypothetical protein
VVKGHRVLAFAEEILVEVAKFPAVVRFFCRHTFRVRFMGLRFGLPPAIFYRIMNYELEIMN